jgi:hypothetical protein
MRCRNKTTLLDEQVKNVAATRKNNKQQVNKLPGEREKRRKDRSTVKASDFT